MSYHISYALESHRGREKLSMQYRYKTETFASKALGSYAEDWMSCVGRYWKFGMDLFHLCISPQKSKDSMVSTMNVLEFLTIIDILRQWKADLT